MIWKNGEHRATGKQTQSTQYDMSPPTNTLLIQIIYERASIKILIWTSSDKNNQHRWFLLLFGWSFSNVLPWPEKKTDSFLPSFSLSCLINSFVTRVTYTMGATSGAGSAYTFRARVHSVFYVWSWCYLILSCLGSVLWALFSPFILVIVLSLLLFKASYESFGMLKNL
jgi:hypothetical protein